MLVLVLLMSLCACGANNDDNIDSSSSADENINTTTNDTSENQTNDTTENSAEESQNTEKEESNGTTEDSDAATNETPSSTNETPFVPAGCSHTWKDATCTAPKTCTKCGEAEGNSLGHTLNQPTCTEPQTCTRCGLIGNPANGHIWSSATCAKPKTCATCGATEGGLGDHNYLVNGLCGVCGEKEPVNVDLTDGEWRLDALNGSELDRFKLTFSGDGTGYMSVSFWGTQQSYGTPFNFNGTNYYDQGFGKGAELTYTENGDTVAVDVSAYGGMNVGSITLNRTAIDQYTVTAVSGTIINSNITSVVTVGTVFTGVG